MNLSKYDITSFKKPKAERGLTKSGSQISGISFPLGSQEFLVIYLKL